MMEATLIKYKIITDGDGLLEKEGELITIKGFKCVIDMSLEEGYWGNYDHWVVTHLETGMLVANDLSREAVIEVAKKRLGQFDAAVRVERAKQVLKERGVEFPVNAV